MVEDKAIELSSILNDTFVKATKKPEVPEEIAEFARAVDDLTGKLNSCKAMLFARSSQAEGIWVALEETSRSNKKNPPRETIKLDPFKESTQIEVTKAQTLTSNLIGRGVNNYDNTNISMVRNVNRIDSDVSLGLPIDFIITLTPVFLIHTVMHFSVGLWYTYYKRDAWDSYFFKEGKELEKIQKSLKNNPPLDPEILKEIILLLIMYEEDTREFEKAIAIAATAHASQRKKGYQLLIQENDSEPGQEKNFPPKTLQPTDSIKPNEPLSLGQKAKNWFVSLPGSSGFNTFFAFAWNYWFVFYYCCWGIVGFSMAAVSPALGLLALAAPAIYLVYKEYIAYTTWSVANETALNDEDKKRLDSVEEAQKENELKKILREKADEATQFRYGWLLVALITGITVITVCGLPIIPAILTGIAVSVGIVLICKGVVDFLSKKATLRREALLDTSNRLKTSIEEKPRKEWRKERISLLKTVTHQVATLSPQQALWRDHITYAAERIYSLRALKPANKIDIDHGEAVCTKEIVQQLQKNIEDAINSTSAIQQNQQAQESQARLNESNSKLDTIRKWVGTILDFLVNYMLICLIGFSVLNWLDIAVIPIVIALGGAPIVLMDALICNVIVGILGLVFAGAASYGTWKAEEKEAAEIQAMRDDVTNQTKQNKIQYFKAQTLTLRNELRNALAAHITNFEAQTKNLSLEKKNLGLTHLKKLAQLIEKPVKEPKSTLRWLAKRYLWGVDGSLHIASALLIVRAALTLGFFATTAALAGPAALIVFGSAALATNPIGIAILVLTVVVLLARLIRQFYLERQKVKELKQLHFVNQRLEKEQSAYENLLYVQALLKNEQDLIDAPVISPQPSLKESSGYKKVAEEINAEDTSLLSDSPFHNLTKRMTPNNSSSRSTPTSGSGSGDETPNRDNDEAILEDPLINTL